ncbi:MFS transporter [Bacillus solimangrovi]|nr:MFS transporter [Bacillus solimangrovi]
MKLERTGLQFRLVYFFIFFSFGSLFPLLSVFLRNDAGLSGTQIGTIISLSPVVMIFIQPFWGIVSDATQRPRFVLTLTLCLTGLTALLYLLVDTYFLFIIVALLSAFFQSAIVPVSDSLSLSYVQRSGENYGSIRLYGALGFSAAVLVAGWFADQFGIHVIFYLFAFILIFVSLLSFRLPEESQQMKINMREGSRTLLKMPRFILIIAATFCVFGPVLANNFYFGIYLEETGATLTGIGVAFLLAAGSEAPFMKVAHNFIGRLGLVNVLLFASIVSAFRWGIYIFEPPLFIVYVTTIMQGISVGLYVPAALQYVRELAPQEVRSTAVSLYSAAGNGFGNWFCAFSAGFIIEFLGVSSLYILFAFLTVLGTCFIIMIYRLDKVVIK